MSQEHRRSGFANQSQEKIRELARPSAAEAQAAYAHAKGQAEAAIQEGDYPLAAASYSLLLGQALIVGDTDMRIEASLRLAGVTHKLGDDAAATEFVASALTLHLVTGSSFDIQGFLKDEYARFSTLYDI